MQMDVSHELFAQSPADMKCGCLRHGQWHQPLRHASFLVPSKFSLGIGLTDQRGSWLVRLELSLLVPCPSKRVPFGRLRCGKGIFRDSTFMCLYEP